MTRNEVIQQLQRDPFIPIRLCLANRKRVQIKEKNVANPMSGGVLVVYPIKPGSRCISGYDVFGYESIERIEPLKKK